MVGRHPVGNAGQADLALGPHQPLGHGRLGDEEGPGDLGRGQAAQGPQGQRHPGFEGQRRVAAGEHQPEAVVGNCAHVRLLPVARPAVVGVVDQGRVVVLLGPAALAPGPIDGLAAGDGQQPGARPVGEAGPGPVLEGGHIGLLEGVLGEVEIAQRGDEGGEHPPRLLPERVLALRRAHRGQGRYRQWGKSAGSSMSGRTSALSRPRRTPGSCEASSVARSRSGTSTM